MTQPYLQLQFDTIAINALIVLQGYKQHRIQDQCRILFADLELPAEVTEEADSSSNSDLFEAGMAHIAQTLDISSCSRAVIFVSDIMVSFRHIELPFSSEKKISQVLSFELADLMPNEQNSYISDFQLMDSLDDTQAIFSVSLPEDIIENMFAVLEGYGIRPVMICPAGCSAALAFTQKNKIIPENFAFAYATQAEITIVLMQHQKPCAVRNIANSNVSSDQLAVMVEQTIVGYNQLSGQTNSYDIFACTNENLSNKDIVLNAFDPYLKDVTGSLDTTELLTTITMDTNQKYLFNFCQGTYGSSSFFKTHAKSIAVTAAFFLIALAAVLVNTAFDNRRLENQISKIDQQVMTLFQENFPGKKNVQDPYLQIKADISSYLKKYDAGFGKNGASSAAAIAATRLLGELSIRINDAVEIEVSRFLYNNDQLILSGSTDNYNNVDKIKQLIESSPLFKTVNISSAAADKKSTRVNFKFMIEI